MRVGGCGNEGRWVGMRVGGCGNEGRWEGGMRVCERGERWSVRGRNGM